MPKASTIAGLLGALLAVGFGLPTETLADRCCYATCKPATGGTLGLLVTCAAGKRDCPRSAGACMVFAHKDEGVKCDERRGCPVGVHGDVGAERLVQQLGTDTGLVVTQVATFMLHRGRTLVFTPRP